MKYLIITIIIILIVSLSCQRDIDIVDNQPLSGQLSKVVKASNNYFIKFKNKHNAILPAGATHYTNFDVIAIELTDNELVAFQNDANVEYVEPIYARKICSQNIPVGIKRIGTVDSSYNKIDNQEDYPDIDIVINDTGVDWLHPDLNVYQNINFSRSPNYNDNYGHGTHVAGIASARDNNIGVVGACAGARIWNVKVLGDDGWGYDDGILKGFDYILTHADEIEVVNMSWGGGAWSITLANAIQKCVEAGVVMVAAAGNSSMDIYGADKLPGTYDDFFPASLSCVITVTAMVETDGIKGGLGTSTTYGSDDDFCSFSNFSAVKGFKWVDGIGAGIAVAAPGVNVLSTYPNNKYMNMSGTSMASPHASGVVADLILKHGLQKSVSGVLDIWNKLIQTSQSQSLWRGTVNDRDVNHEGLALVTSGGVKYEYPELTILKPTASDSLTENSIITLQGYGHSAEGDISHTIDWFDGNLSLGTGSVLNVHLAGGRHNIVAKVKDNAGRTSIRNIMIDVWFLGKLSTPRSLDVALTGWIFPPIVLVSWVDNQTNVNYYVLSLKEKIKNKVIDKGVIAYLPAVYKSTYVKLGSVSGTTYEFTIKAKNGAGLSSGKTTRFKW